jgi:uncharacterized cupin superfamily protein
MMDKADPRAATPLAIVAAEAPVRTRPSNYPPVFAARMEGRVKQPLGDLFGLRNFGVNRTTLNPGAVSALQHRHSRQDEFVYVLEGELWLVAGETETRLEAGMCAGFAAGGISHHLENRSWEPAVYLEIGDRSPGDVGSYPDDDLVANHTPEGWRFTHKDGTPY